MDEDRTLTRRRNSASANGRLRLRVALPLVAAMLLLSACGSASNDDVVPAAPSGEQSGATVDTQLTVSIDYGAGKTDTWTLTCDPTGGSHPEAAKACAALEAKGKTALPPVAKDMMCTQIYGGDQTAEVAGTWKGQPIQASLNRKNGCEISRWKALEGLLPAVAGAGPQ